MRQSFDSISDDEIRVITPSPEESGKKGKHRTALWIGAAALLMLLIIGLLWMRHSSASNANDPAEEGYFEEMSAEEGCEAMPNEPLLRLSSCGDDITGTAFAEYVYRQINDIELRIVIPHNADAELAVGRIDSTDTSILCAAMAADIRADNGGILGAFVLKGKPLAWGLSKKGYCAIIDGVFSVGMADNSPLFEEATEKEGYFFRQYPLVADGMLVESELKNKSFRRALCSRAGEIFIVDTQSRESMHDFAQALVDLGVENAVYLVGGQAWGFARNKEGAYESWGAFLKNFPKNTNYILWRSAVKPQ